jgi:predicted transcriptional regulator of viral defense system
MPTKRTKGISSRASDRAVRAAAHGLVRPRDLAAQQVTRTEIARLTRDGKLVRLGRGLYAAPDAPLTEHHSLAEAAKRVPNGVVCLLSALRFHGLTTQNPFEVWIAIGHKARRPQISDPPLRLVHMSGPSATAGIETHVIEGVPVRVFSAAKSVIDCFRFRNKIGLDVALEALRDYKRRHRGGMDAIWHFATVGRVSRVMQPYVEASW